MAHKAAKQLILPRGKDENGCEISEDQKHSNKAYNSIVFTFELQIWVILVLIAVARKLAYM